MPHIILACRKTHILEKAFSKTPAFRHDLQHDRATAGRLATDCHSRGITTEEMDVLLHPLESEVLIEQTGVRSAEVSHFRGAQEAECSQLSNVSTRRMGLSLMNQPDIGLKRQ